MGGLLSPPPPPVMGGLLNTGMSGLGLAPFGLRHSGEAAKGKGFFGVLQRPDGQGFSTEISTSAPIGGVDTEHPLLVPTLSKQEINHLLSDGDPTDAIYKKAFDHAVMRLGRGMSPFAGPTEVYAPLPTE